VGIVGIGWRKETAMSKDKPTWTIDYTDQKALLREYRQAFRTYVMAEREGLADVMRAAAEYLDALRRQMTDETRKDAARYERLRRAQAAM
jgi:hypothetical protein